MIFIETTIFTRQVLELLPDEKYRELQSALIDNPEIGSVIQGGGGLRKLRWAIPGHGKRGGVRVIYYLVTQDKILLVYLYRKTQQDDLTFEQLNRLRKVIEEE